MISERLNKEVYVYVAGPGVRRWRTSAREGRKFVRGLEYKRGGKDQRKGRDPLAKKVPQVHENPTKGRLGETEYVPSLGTMS